MNSALAGEGKWGCLVLLIFAGCSPQHVATDSRSCGTCHAEQFAAWSQSAHATSGTSPTFTALLSKTEHSLGTVASTRCQTCHANPSTDGCISCHLAIGNRGTLNGNIELDLNGPISTARTVDAPHETLPRTFLTSNDLCGTCHEVHGPGLLEEPTFTEFTATNPPPDVTCASCHLDEHRFNAREGEALKLEWTDSQLIVTNTNARHDVPTGMSAVRDVWVDATIETIDGDTLLIERVIELGARIDGPSPLFPDATAIVKRGLAFNASRTWSAPPGARIVQAVTHSMPVRAEVIDALK